MYDFVNGIYAIGQNAAGDRRFSENVTFYRLPPHPTPLASKEGGVVSVIASGNGTPSGASKGDTWTYAFGMTILDFTMDPEQDFLVLLALAPPELVLFLWLIQPIYISERCAKRPPTRKVSIFLSYLSSDFIRQRNASTSRVAFLAIPSKVASDRRYRPRTCVQVADSR